VTEQQKDLIVGISIVSIVAFLFLWVFNGYGLLLSFCKFIFAVIAVSVFHTVLFAALVFGAAAVFFFLLKNGK